MARSKKPRNKRYDPARSKNRFLRRQAERCILYRWSSSTDRYGDFEGYGPYPPDKSEALLHWALGRPETWLCTAIACFVTEEREYYEEMITLPAFGPVNLDKNAEALDDQIVAATQEAKGSGNPKHFVDAVIALSLYTETLDQKLDDDDWVKEQASRRADLILEKFAA